ncbi:MAG: glycoside hydrolase family 104 protein [Prevotella pallens]|uniref:glycoside hydrolase family 24 protein n=1 Tax=Prevotella pallens TaxID=60133 RepID=UPI001CB0F5FD|nr:glycoside hydrolase family 104 protein [Prevotella pallens]MBF1489834.1 glycoside hydrolase family 104 protein [Prevotella pallens]
MAKQLENYLEDKNVQAFLALIRDTEGTAKGADPYRVYGGSAKNQIKDLSKPDFKRWGFTQTDGKKNTSSASGAYQFLERTWNGLAKEHGLTDFSPRSQDLGAIALLKQSGALDSIVKGDFDTAVKKANRIWASLPGSPYAQHTRSNDYVAQSLAKHLGEDVDLAKYKMPVGEPIPKQEAPTSKTVSTSPSVQDKVTETLQEVAVNVATPIAEKAVKSLAVNLFSKVLDLFLRR